MKSFPPEKIRNVALVGHGGAGKTTLTEALLLCTGAINRLGRVEDGTTTTDFDAEEVKRKISVSLALAPIEFDGHKINVIDCPGYADFFPEVDAALRVADLAVFVVSAVEGVEVQTEAAWRLAAEREIPRMVFISKLDRERASFERTLDQLRDVFGAGIAPLELPIGEEGEFRGVADLLTDVAITYDTGSPVEGEIPADMEALEQLPGVGHKTASVVMNQAFGQPAFPVDTHIHRLAARWGLSKAKDVKQTERDLKRLWPRQEWGRRHLQIIYFGREHCPARNHAPAECPICSVV